MNTPTNSRSRRSWPRLLAAILSLSAALAARAQFNEDPPLILGEQDQGRDINTYDALGRLFFVSASYKF